MTLFLFLQIPFMRSFEPKHKFFMENTTNTKKEKSEKLIKFQLLRFARRRRLLCKNGINPLRMLNASNFLKSES